MAKFPYQYVNINGIPTIKTQTVVVSDTAVTFKFAPDFDGRPFRGLILVYISEAIPEGTTNMSWPVLNKCFAIFGIFIGISNGSNST